MQQDAPVQSTTALELLTHVQRNHALVKRDDFIECSCGMTFWFTAPKSQQDAPVGTRVVHLDYGKEAVCQIEVEDLKATHDPEEVTCLACLRIAAHSFIELEKSAPPVAPPTQE